MSRWPIRTREQEIEDFWARIDKSGGPEACWPWKAGKHVRGGYGAVRFLGKTRRANRIAYELTFGETNLFVLHSCDNPPCCNPAHLFAGTNLDNVLDMHRKGRDSPPPEPPKGVNHHSARLSPTQVLTIRDEAGSSRELARKYGVARTTIKRIKQRKIWKDL